MTLLSTAARPLSPDASVDVAQHLAGMDKLFSEATRREMVEMQSFLAALKRIGTTV